MCKINKTKTEYEKTDHFNTRDIVHIVSIRMYIIFVELIIR